MPVPTIFYSPYYLVQIKCRRPYVSSFMILLCMCVVKCRYTGSSNQYICALFGLECSQFCIQLMANMSSSQNTDDPEPMDVKESEVDC